MSYSSLSAEVRTIAEKVLTPKQLEYWQYELAGWKPYPIATRLGVTKSAVRDRQHNTHKNLLNAGVRMDEFGRWTVEEEVAA